MNMSLWHNLTKCHERQAFSFGLLIQATPHPSFTQEHGNFGCFVGRSSLRCRNVVDYLPVKDAGISVGVSLTEHIYKELKREDLNDFSGLKLST